MKPSPYRLVTIAFSHYNEKARWALERYRVPYRESAHLPVFHFFAVFRANHFLNASDKMSTAGSTPVLVTPHSRLSDSTDILQYLSGKYGTLETTLYPNDASRALETRFAILGDHTRRLAYFYALSDAALCKKIAKRNVPGWQSTLWRFFFPLIRRLLTRGLRVYDKRVERSKGYIEAEFQAVSEMLVDGRTYLTGDWFTAADLTFACMAVPALLITTEEGYSSYLPSRDEVPHAFSEWASRLRETSAGQFVLRLFRDERKRIVTKL